MDRLEPQGYILSIFIAVRRGRRGSERCFQQEFEDELKIYRKRDEIRKGGKKNGKGVNTDTVPGGLIMPGGQ
jgi:hypothetical protein